MNGDTDTAATHSSEAKNTANSDSTVPEERDIFGGHAVLKKYKTKLRVEIVGLFALMTVVWGLLALPIVFYCIPSSVVSAKNNCYLAKAL